jgi:hypothetical protein
LVPKAKTVVKRMAGEGGAPHLLRRRYIREVETEAIINALHPPIQNAQMGSVNPRRKNTRYMGRAIMEAPMG